MKNASTIHLDKKSSAINGLPQPIGSIANPELKMTAEISVVFVDEAWMEQRPSLEYYRQLYKAAGYTSDMIESLLQGLSKSSLYDGKTT